jgi:hypothetical protein
LRSPWSFRRSMGAATGRCCGAVRDVCSAGGRPPDGDRPAYRGTERARRGGHIGLLSGGLPERTAAVSGSDLPRDRPGASQLVRRRMARRLTNAASSSWASATTASHGDACTPTKSSARVLTSTRSSAACPAPRTASRDEAAAASRSPTPCGAVRARGSGGDRGYRGAGELASGNDAASSRAEPLVACVAVASDWRNAPSASASLPEAPPGGRVGATLEGGSHAEVPV